MRNLQVGPDGATDTLAALVPRIKYKPGWTFELKEIQRRWGGAGLTLLIGAEVANSLDPSTSVGILHLMPVPPLAYDERNWIRWILDQILLVEQHEAMEFFQIGDERPYFPEHGEGCDFYRIAEVKTRELVEKDPGPWFEQPPMDGHFA